MSDAVTFWLVTGFSLGIVLLCVILIAFNSFVLRHKMYFFALIALACIAYSILAYVSRENTYLEFGLCDIRINVLTMICLIMISLFIILASSMRFLDFLSSNSVTFNIEPIRSKSAKAIQKQDKVRSA